MTKLLNIAAHLTLPLDVVTEALAFLGRRGSGKTYAAQKLAEEMHRLQAQFVALDPVGIWYGLRLAADGKSPGLPVPVLGGLHGDIPLEVTGGALIADLVVDRGASVVIDVSQFESDADKARFAQAFANRFFFRKKASPSAVHVFLEECQEFIPQNPQGEETRMLHAFNRMVKIGRNFGIGMSMISQRPQEVNKKSLNLAEILFAFQMTGPQERKTIEGWIAEKGIDEDIAGELPKLARGEPHVWSPALLKISRRVQIDRKTTFDASSTPKVGKEAGTRHLSPIDLEQLRTDMAATIEKAKAEDPKLLRAEIARLRAEKKPFPDVHPDPKALEQAERRGYERGRAESAKALRTAADAIGGSNAAIAKASTELASIQLRLYGAEDAAKARQNIPEIIPPARAPRPQQAPQRAPAGPGEALPKSERLVLTALAQYPQGRTKVQVAILTGYAVNGGGFANAIGALRSAGRIEGGSERLVITPAGLEAVGAFHPLPRGRELLEHWYGRLGKAERKALEALVEVYPRTLSKAQIAARAGYEENGGGFNNALGKLRSLELIRGRGEMKASEELFDA